MADPDLEQLTINEKKSKKSKKNKSLVLEGGMYSSSAPSTPTHGLSESARVGGSERRNSGKGSRSAMGPRKISRRNSQRIGSAKIARRKKPATDLSASSSTRCASARDLSTEFSEMSLEAAEAEPHSAQPMEMASCSTSRVRASTDVLRVSAPTASTHRSGSSGDMFPAQTGSEPMDDGDEEEEDDDDMEGGFFGRIKRGLMWSIGTSSFGKSAILRVLPHETQNLVRALLLLVEVDSGSKARAKEMESNVFKFLIKLAIDHDAKKISYKDFLVADKPLRAAFNLLCKCFVYYGDTRGRNLTPAFQKVEEYFTEVEALIRQALERKLTWNKQQLNRLRSILQQVGTREFLERCWANPDLEDVLFDLYSAMEKYTQFHYYSKSTGQVLS
mmetsp:Transcript_6936/g.17502  ORF Transcript_6936/g.17502 Transcript_6936/m.17502 type:complete len:388 (+) Transcript_6936:73-1236(+)